MAHYLVDYGRQLATFAALVLAFRVVERGWPIDRQQSPHPTLFNAGYYALRLALETALGPLIGLSGLVIVNAAGGGRVELRSDGFWFPVSVLVLLIAGDLIGYLWHVCQHKVPMLWAMHSFHHSEEAMNATSGPRIFWLESVLNNALIFPCAGILVKAPPSVALTSGTISFVLLLFVHLNARIHFGPLWMLLNSPQFHRVHHSARHEHIDRNYATFFPFIDVIFGTACRPRRGEWPPTGLITGETPATLAAALAWPVRRLLS